jgi:membrane-bound ClpP family serine protease
MIRTGDVVVVPLRGEVAPALLTFLRRAVKSAETKEASAIVFDMNIGGRLDTAADIVNALNQSRIPPTPSSTPTPDLRVRSSRSRHSIFTWRR